MRHYGFIRDLAIVILSFGFSVLLMQSDILDVIFRYTEGMRLLTAFLGGMFFVSIFTAAPAMAVLLKIFSVGGTFDVVLAATIGSLIGDMVILTVVKDEIGKYLILGLKKMRQSKLIHFFRKPLMRGATKILGALVIMSPFPDELGITLMGVSRLSTFQIGALLFILDFIGLFVIALTV